MPAANKHIEKAEKLLQKSKIEAALEEYLLAWQDEPNNDAIVYTVADLYQKLNKPVQSRECFVFLFDKAVEKGDGMKVLELLRKMQVVGASEPSRFVAAAQLLEKTRPDLASEQYRRVLEMTGDHNPEFALQCLLGMARLQPGSLDVNRKLATAAAKLGNTAVAIGAYRKLAELYLPIAKYKEATDALEQVCVLAPKDVAAQIALAKAYMKAKRAGNVIAMWKDVGEQSEDREVLNLMAQAFLAERETAKAEAIYWKLLDGSPETAGVLLEIAKQYVAKDDDESMSGLMKAIEDRLTQDHPSKELIQLVEKIGRLEHTSVPTLESLARLLDRFHLDSPLAPILNTLFDLYYASKQFPKAAEVLARNIDIDPYNPEATQKLERLRGKVEAAVLRDMSSRLGIDTAPAPAPGGGAVGEQPETGSESSEPAQGPDGSANPLKDLMLQAEIFQQYGMKDKARERMERIVKLFPGEENRNEELASLFEKSGFVTMSRPAAPSPVAAGSAVGPSAPQAAPQATDSRDFRADLRRVSEISRNLSRQANVKAVLFTAVNDIGRYWQVSRCVVGLATPNRPPTMAMEYISHGIAASDASKLGKLVMGLQQANAGKNFPLVAESVIDSPTVAALHDTLAALQVDSLVAIPLRDGEQEIGVLVLEQCGQKRTWKGNDLAGLEALAEQIVLAVANVRLRNLMKALAVTDERSGLLHRDSYITCLLSEAERMRTQRTALSVVLLRFSSTTPEAAQAGAKMEASKPSDEKKANGLEPFVQKFSASVMGQLRQNDMAIIYAANTLALILPGATGKDAASVTEKMRRHAVATAGVPADAAPRMAAGVAEVIREGGMDGADRITEVINRLEWALDAACQAGPSTVKVLDPPALPE